MAALDQTVLSLFQKWQITSFLLGSLITQTLMAVTGAARTWGFRPVHIVAWAAYNMRDYLATTALGALAQAASTQVEAVYALWAPILLLHLGGPDNFCVWQMDDAEVWPRQCLTFGLQLLAASYVMAKCAVQHRSWAFVLLSFCLFAAGGLKYVERILTMKQATGDAITESVMPIYFYMLGEPRIRLGRHDHPDQAPHYNFIVRGEKEWFKHYQQAGESHDFEAVAEKARPKLITVDDVLHSSIARAEGDQNSLLCIAYAMYKMYKRRLSHLFMFEWRQGKMKDLLLGSTVRTPLRSTEDVLRVLDAELAFLYDRLYTKSVGTVMSGLGLLLRMASVLLFAATWVYLLRSSSSDLVSVGSNASQAKWVTLLLVSAALVLEMYQLLRILASDWARVWLISTYCRMELQSAATGERPFISGKHRLGMCTLSIFLFVSNNWMPRAGHLYWRPHVGQYSMANVHTLGTKPTSHLRRLVHYLSAQQEESSLDGLVAKRFQLEVMRRVLERCHELRSKTHLDVSKPMWFLFDYTVGHDHEEVAVVWALMGGNIGDAIVSMDLEHLVLNCHVATLLCELLLIVDTSSSNTTIGMNLPPQSQSIGLGMQLSRYAMHLLVHKTELLPCHTAITLKLANDTHRALNDVLASLPTKTRMALLTMIQESGHEPSVFLRDGVKAARLLQAINNEMQRWKLLCDVWVDVLVHMAHANRNPSAHLQELMKGGELLNHLWVLLGHMGYGQQ